jgi:arylformamidase
MKLVRIGVGLAVLLAACGSQAQEGKRVSRECRREIRQVCGLTFSRDKIRECLTEKFKELSEDCRGEIVARVRQRADEKGRVSALMPGATEYTYGSASLQKLDYFPAKASQGKAPLLVFVHGGGWKRGDKGNATGKDLAPHYSAQGYAVASINYRLVPEATVEQQAADVAQSIAWLRSNSAKLGIDPARIVLMGHSAGAHLVALVGTDPQYLRGAGLGLDAVCGVIPNDGAAYDVAAQMTDGPKMMQDTYAQAFGTDPARQRALSPTYQAASPNAPAFLLIHVQRPDGVRQAAALAVALKRAGTRVQVSGFPGDGLSGHMAINRRLGDPTYPATPVVDAWLKAVFAG